MKIKEIIKEHEGFRDKIYLCSEGFPTIGYGHKVLPDDPFVEGVAYDKQLLEEVFDKDFAKAKEGATRLLSNMDIAEDAVDVVTSMVFQLGEGGVSKFKNMFASIRSRRLCRSC